MTMKKNLALAVSALALATMAALTSVGSSSQASTAPTPTPTPTQTPTSPMTTTEGASQVRHIPNTTWQGATLFAKKNDWEPDVSADPRAPYVYVATTRYGSDNGACGKCPHPSIVVKASSDNGATWSHPTYMCVCRGIGWQADPQLEVATDGTVYGLILQGSGGHGWVEVEARSTDHGATWGPAVNTTPDLRKTIDQHSADHGFLTISPDGKDQYVAFEGRRNWVVSSHDYGATWGTPVETSLPSDPLRRWYYDFKGAVTAGGVVNIAVSTVSAKPYATHRVVYFDLRSADKGATWTRTRLASYKEQPPCLSKGCPGDHLGANTNLAADASGNLMQVFAGSTVKANGQAIYASTSSDGGLTWSPPKLMSPKTVGGRRVVASFPAITGGVAGDFRMWWMDDRKGIDAWNVWYTETNDGGATWSPDVRISDAISGTDYISSRGFLADYGDYGGIEIMNNGQTIGAWGEGVSYDGPGGTWINRSL